MLKQMLVDAKRKEEIDLLSNEVDQAILRLKKQSKKQKGKGFDTERDLLLNQLLMTLRKLRNQAVLMT